MATATMNTYCDASSLANFNAWAYWMYQQFIAFGWTQTADSGQGTFPASGSAPSSAGSYFAIFQSADTLSGACPITVKIEFWESSNTPNFGVTVGTGGTDGAGNLLAPFSQRMYGGGTYQLLAYSANASNSLACYASGDTGSIRFAMWNAGTANPDYYNLVYIVIARSRDASGNLTSNYVQVWTGCNSGKQFQTVFSPLVGTTNSIDSSNYLTAAFPYISGNNSWSAGGAVCVGPVMQNIGGLSKPLLYCNTDVLCVERNRARTSLRHRSGTGSRVRQQGQQSRSRRSRCDDQPDDG